MEDRTQQAVKSFRHTPILLSSQFDNRHLVPADQPPSMHPKGRKVAWWGKKAVPFCDFKGSSAPNLSHLAADAGNSFKKE